MTITIFENTKEFESFEAGQVIFEEDQPGDLMYVVKEGEVELSVKGTVIETVTAGGILGEMALIDASPRSARAVTKTECKLVPITERRFLFLVQQTPFFSIEVMKIMANRLRRMNAQTNA